MLDQDEIAFVDLRAFQVSQRVAELEGLNADLAAALDSSPDGIFILSADGRVRHANKVGQRLLRPEGALRLEAGRLVAVDPTGAWRLEAAIAAATCADRSGRCARELTVPSPHGGAPLAVTLTPRLSGPEAVFGRGAGAIARVSDPDARSAGQARALRARFGFTPAEIRVALAVGAGASPRQAAVRLGVSFHTVRHQLQSIYEKAGVNRQSELVLILSRALEP